MQSIPERRPNPEKPNKFEKGLSEFINKTLRKTFSAF